MKLLLFSTVLQRSYGGLKHWVCVRRLSSQLVDIRQQLLQYKGGTVNLTKNTDTGIAVLTLNHPGRKNAVSGRMMVELTDHVTELSQWQEGKGVILRGADNTFCSGGDLSTMAALITSQEGAGMSHLMQDTMTRLRSLPLVSLALLEGLAIGGGAELAMACDVRAMTHGAKLGFVQMKMGVTTGWAGGTHLVRLLGRHKTLQLLGSSKILKPQEAMTIGLVEHCLDENAASLQVAESLLLENYCRGPTHLVRALKGMVVNIENSASVMDALEAERDAFCQVWGGDAHRSALERNVKHS